MANEGVEEVSLKRNGLLRLLAIPYAVRKIRLRANACASCQILDGAVNTPNDAFVIDRQQRTSSGNVELAEALVDLGDLYAESG